MSVRISIRIVTPRTEENVHVCPNQHRKLTQAPITRTFCCWWRFWYCYQEGITCQIWHINLLSCPKYIRLFFHPCKLFKYLISVRAAPLFMPGGTHMGSPKSEITLYNKKEERLISPPAFFQMYPAELLFTEQSWKTTWSWCNFVICIKLVETLWRLAVVSRFPVLSWYTYRCILPIRPEPHVFLQVLF